MYVNGRTIQYRDGLTLYQLLNELAIDHRAVAVMHGDEVYRRGQVPDVPVAPNDVIEIVTMMQGG